MTVWLTCLSIADSHGLPSRLRAVPGAILEELGIVSPITSHVEANINLRPLATFSSLAHYHLRQLESLQIQVTRELKHEQSSLLLQTINNTISQLSTLVERKHRAKRGLVNVVDKIAHALFGIVDDDTFTSKFETYQNSISKITTRLDASIHTVNTIADNVHELRQAFYNVNKTFETLSAKLNNSNIFTELSFNVLSYQVTINRVMTTVSSFVSALISAARGEVLPSLISPHDFHPILQNISSFNLSSP